jgi:predicted phage terminase large subunit-like protein
MQRTSKNSKRSNKQGSEARRRYKRRAKSLPVKRPTRPSPTAIAAFHAVLRQHLRSFCEKVFATICPSQIYVPNWHVDLIADRLEQCQSGRIKRLIITMPPRYLKSIVGSVAFPAFLLGHDPTARIVCVSYAQDLAEKHAADCRLVMNSPWYRRLFPKTVLSRETAGALTTTQRGFRLATSVGGTLTGLGGNIIIIDDYIKPQDALSDAKRAEANNWFEQTLFSRLDSKTDSVIIVIMQRLHVDDLVGRLLSRSDHWVHLNLPAIAAVPERFELGDGRIFTRAAGEPLHATREPLQVLDEIRAAMGSLTFAAQYLQDPAPLEGGLIKWFWFKSSLGPPVKQPGDLLIHSWDTASKADEVHDYSVCTVWLSHAGANHLLDVHRERLEYPLLKKRIMELAIRDQPDLILIEDKASGTHLLQDLAADQRLPLTPILPSENKVIRAIAASARIEGGQVFVPVVAPWLDEFKREILAFPQGRFDDQVDSMSQYLTWIGERIPIDAPYFVKESAFATAAAYELGTSGPAPWDIFPTGRY